MTKNLSSLIILFLLVTKFYAQDPYTKNTSAEKYNFRGMYASNNFSLNGKEIISDYDGNILLNYTTACSFPNNLSGDLSVIYNANVDHRVFNLNDNASINGYMVNTPEWIIGYKGIALQALNFQNRYFISSNGGLEGEKVMLIMPGYHYDGNTTPYVLGKHDYIEILQSDGSKILLENTEAYKDTGLYKEKGKKYGFAVAKWYTIPNYNDANKFRRIWYKPGDGLTYYFEEEPIDFVELKSTKPGDAKAPYLKAIYSPNGDTLKFFYDFIKGDFKYGRKAFKYMTSNRIKSNALGEISIDYSQLLISTNSYITVNNYNTDDLLKLYVTNPNPNLFKDTIDSSSSRILYLSKIEDKISRTDQFVYYPLSDKIAQRFYRNSRMGDFYAGDNLFSAAFSINHKVYLLNNIKYSNSKESVIYYWGSFFDPANIIDDSFDFKSNKPYLPQNIRFASRDCFTNFMVRKREIFDKYSGAATKTSTEEYSYTGNGTEQYYPPVNDIKTTVLKTNNLPGEKASPDSITIIKSFSRFGLPPGNPMLADALSTVALVQEVQTDNVSGKVVKDYTYDKGSSNYQLIDSYNSYSYYDGTLDLTAVRESKYAGGTPGNVKRDSLSYIYSTINLYSGASLLGSIKFPVEFYHYDSQSLTKYKSICTNFIPTSCTLNTASNAIYAGNLIKEEKTYSGYTVKSNILNEYFTDGDNIGKLKKSTSFPSTAASKTMVFEYFTKSESSYLWGLLKSKKNLQTGVIQNYQYPKLTGPNLYQATASGIKVKYDYSNYSGNFIQPDMQLYPFRTVSYYKNEYSFLTKTSASNNNYTKNYGGAVSNVNSGTYPVLMTTDVNGRILSSQDYYSMLPTAVALQDSFVTSGYLSFSVKTELYNEFFNRIKIGGIADDGKVYGSVYLPMQNTPDLANMKVDVSAVISQIREQSKKISGFLITSDRPDAAANIKFVFSGTPVFEYGGGRDSLVNYTAYDKKGNLKFAIDENSIYSEYNYDGAGRITNSSLPLSFYDGINSNYSGIFLYNDQNNTTSEIKRINNAPSALLSIEDSSYYNSLGALKRLRRKNVDGNVYETKTERTNNYLGLVQMETDGEGRTIKYYYDYLNRPVKILNGDGTFRTIEYFPQTGVLENGSLWQTNYFEYSKMIDENRNLYNAVYRYFDKAGNKVAEKTGNTKPTVYKYDEIYRLKQVITPEGQIKNYYYDYAGNISMKESPADEGTVKYKKDKFGQTRFIMNAQAIQTERGISFTKYDTRGRKLISGTLFTSIGFENLNPELDYAQNQNLSHFENLQTDTANFVEVNMYDMFRKSGIFAQMPDPFTWSQSDANSSRNLKGRLVATAFRDKPGQEWNYKIYLYDQLGRVTHMYLKFSNKPWKYIYKETDNIGNVKREFFYKILNNSSVGEQFAWYNYDRLGRLAEVRTNTTGDYNTAKLEATYTCNKADQTSTLTYNQVTNQNALTTFGYKPGRGLLNSINNGTGNFTETLEFYNNGNVYTQTLVNTALGAGGRTLTYNYDSLNRVQNVLNGAAVTESFIYNNDGNIKYRGYAGSNGINYYYDGNRLSSINFNGTAFSYGCDSRGNIISDQRKGIVNIEYDQRNLPLKITGNLALSRYRYDDEGQRIYKESNGKKEYYLRDDRGLELAVYDAQTDKLSMVNLYGQDLIGRVDVSYNSVWDPEWEEYVEARTDRKVYFVKDHQGSIRQSFGVTGNFVSGYDYYAYGQIKSSITVGTPNDKYKYTGKERDSETGYDYFGARQYDSELGLWLSVDPLEFNNPGISPYSYCSDDPINRVDADGMDDDPVHQGKTLPPVDVLSRRWWKEMSDKYLTFSAGETKALTGLAVVATVEPTPMGEAVWGFVAGGIITSKIIYDLLNESNEESAAEKLPDLDGKTKEEAKKILKEHGFVDKGQTSGGYEKHYHPDGSRVQIRPNGEVVRTGPKINPSKGGRSYRPRYNPNGERTPEHNTGEFIK